MVRTMLSVLKIPPATFREMWLSPRGREWARRYAFKDLGYDEYLNTPFLLTGSEFLHQSLFPGPSGAKAKSPDKGAGAASAFTPEHDELFWNLSRDLHAAYINGKLTDRDGLALAMAWINNDSFARAWPGVDTDELKKLPQLRGPLAYVFGLRSLQQNQRQGAIGYFSLARDTMPAGSPGQRLALAELARLKESE
jgi:hypothetical protein